jgi:phosphoribosylanthranilate isomerase
MSAPLPVPPAVKVCGLTRVADARLAVELGAAFVGLNFWEGSPRRVTVEAARAIADAVAGRALLVGVFVNQPAAEVERIAATVGLDLLQLHGDEDAAAVAAFGARAIKVLRAAGRLEARRFDEHPQVWGFLVEPRRPGAYGGTGEPWAYAEGAGLPTAKPVLLAGGIGPENLRAVLAAARPWGVDVCSAVEARPGVKDAARLRRLFEEVRHAQAAV